jgi:hypothetical protein
MAGKLTEALRECRRGNLFVLLIEWQNNEDRGSNASVWTEKKLKPNSQKIFTDRNWAHGRHAASARRKRDSRSES